MRGSRSAGHPRRNIDGTQKYYDSDAVLTWGRELEVFYCRRGGFEPGDEESFMKQ